MREPLPKPRFPRWLIAILIVVALGIAAGGFWFYSDQNHGARKNVEADLLAIGQLKTQQIANWRAERLGDAGVIAGSQASTALVAGWLDSRQPADAAEILAWFRTLRGMYHYANVQLVDSSGSVLLDLAQATEPLAPDALQGLHTALTDRKAVLTDLHFAADHKTIHLDAIAPLFGAQDPGSPPLGAVILTANASDFLFPLIQTWPTASTSAETLLVRREGGQVLYLNELRHESGAALNLTIPITQTDVPAVKAVLGTHGIVDGIDYRGVKVVAAVQSVPDSPWFIVAKMDTSEAFGGARFRSILIVILTVLILAALIGGTLFTWQRSLKKRYHEAYDLEVSRRSPGGPLRASRKAGERHYPLG